MKFENNNTKMIMLEVVESKFCSMTKGQTDTQTERVRQCETEIDILSATLLGESLLEWRVSNFVERDYFRVCTVQNYTLLKIDL